MAECLVLGAGMVGVTTALALQARGHEVTLIDRRPPGQETSFGNAGLIQSEAAEPYAMPMRAGQLARIAAGFSSDVRWSPRGLASAITALARYGWYSLPSHHAKISTVYHRLISRATDAHGPLIEASGADDLIRKRGWLELHRSDEAMERAIKHAARFRELYNVPSQVLDSVELAQMEPAFKHTLPGAIHWPDSWTCSDPGGLVAGYAALFEERGGQIVTGDASDLHRAGAVWRAAGQEGAFVVIAMGPWSQELCAQFGLKVQMILKRGYHRHYTIATPPQRPVFDMGNSVVMSPMKAGLRIATAADLRPWAHSNPPQLARGEKGARDLFDLGEPIEAKPWSGQRPCMPDMLPVVGAVPGHDGLWAHLGHGHQGFTLGPVTADILADQIDGAPGWDELSPARLT